MTFKVRLLAGGLVGLTPFAAQVALAQNAASAGNATEELQEVVIFARAEQLIGTASAASEGAVGGADLSVRPLLRVAELLEAVPGLIAAQHSGSGKANQYFLRGFNLDHGTDFTTIIDGMPWNLRTHGHGQGYLDVNGLIPEVVERIDYRKGVYRADVGDFSMAGSAFMTTIDSLKNRFVAVEGGQYGWQRVATGGTTDLGAGQLTGIAQWKTYDGPWQRPEDLQHVSMWAKYLQDTALGKLKLTLSGYHATWDPTEQSPEIAIGTPECPDRFCSLDPTAVGETTRWISTLQLINDNWQASTYAQYYDWHMLSDPTYDYQIDQFDRRWTAGGRFDRTLVKSDRFDVRAGAELRHDNIGRVGVNHTEAAQFVDNIGTNSVRETSEALYVEANWRATDALRLMGGLRGDLYQFHVHAINPTSASGSDNDNRISPKLGAAYALNRNLELYANWGQGFHSNDARGVVDPVTPQQGLVKGTGYEGGARWEVGNFKLTGAYWWLNLSSELIFVGDSNAVEPRGGSRRHGWELVAFWKPYPWLGIDAVYTGSNARYTEVQDGEDGLPGRHIEGGVENAGELGISAVKDRWEGSLRVRYLGEFPLVPSNELRADPETMINVRLAWKPGRFTIYGEVLNLLDDDGYDMVYYYPSFIPGITPVGTQEPTRMSRSEEPRTVRVGVKYEF